jgi:hypothetical protein
LNAEFSVTIEALAPSQGNERIGGGRASTT